MQNFFLHPAVRAHPEGLAAHDVLVKKAIPACRAAGIDVVFLNWGQSHYVVRVWVLRNVVWSRLIAAMRGFSGLFGNDGLLCVALGIAPVGDARPHR